MWLETLAPTLDSSCNAAIQHSGYSARLVSNLEGDECDAVVALAGKLTCLNLHQLEKN